MPTFRMTPEEERKFEEKLLAGGGKITGVNLGAIPGPRPRGTPEADFTDRVIAFARKCGWLVAHFRPAKTSTGWRTAVQGDGAGFPDIVLVREVVLFVELKAKGGNLRQEQKVWRDRLGIANANWHLWTPADWPMIQEALR